MWSRSELRRLPGGQGGFTLLEVMIAMGILAVSLVAIFNVQGSSILAASRTKFITTATLLARSKMVDIEMELTEKGFSDFAETMEGDFSQEGWPEFIWHATLTKIKIPIPQSIPGQENNTYVSMMQGYSSMLTDLISNSLRECILTVEWGDGGDMESITVSTHFIEMGRANMLEVPAAGGVSSLQQSAASGSSTSTSTSTTAGKTSGSGSLNLPK